MVAAHASDGFAVDFQSVHEHLRMRAIRFGALPMRTVMADQGAVAVRSPDQTLAAFVPRNFSCSAFTKHGLLLTLQSATAQLPRRSLQVALH
jgi:hypothetical protein